MSTYFGQVRGTGSTAATRQGTQVSGIRASAQSWGGSVIVYMHDDGLVDIEISDGSNFYGKTFFSGTIAGLKEALSRDS